MNWNDPNLRFIDLDGDGHADILITEDAALTWFPSLAREGFGPAYSTSKPFDEERGPALVFADGTQSIYVADFSGDGLTDIVRIRNGEVCYWPNLGYGRFGAKITMDGAPVFDSPELFDHRRIRLAELMAPEQRTSYIWAPTQRYSGSINPAIVGARPYSLRNFRPATISIP